MPTSGGDFVSHLEGRVEATDREVRSLVEGLGPERLLWRPGKKRWGIADCLEHLVLIGDAYHPRIRDALEAAPPPSSAGYRPRLLGRLFHFGGGPRGPVRIPAPRAFVPAPARPDVVDRFLSSQDELRTLIRAAARADLNRARVPWPVTRLLTLTLGEALEFLVLHQRRHLAQARRVRAHDRFPGG